LYSKPTYHYDSCQAEKAGNGDAEQQMHRIATDVFQDKRKLQQNTRSARRSINLDDKKIANGMQGYSHIDL